MKDYKKKLNVKLQSIQEKTLRQITNAYKTISTKTLQVETNIASIDIYLSKLTQRLITNIKLRIANAIIAKTMRRICDNLIFKRDKKSKLRKTSLQFKQR